MPITTPSLFSTGLQGINQSHALLAQSSERLATGLRINRGADDPAGLIASEHLGGQLSSITSRINAMGRTNLELSIQEGSLSAAAFGIRDLGGLVVQGANAAGLTDAESAAIETAASGIVQSIGTLTNASGNPILGDISIQRQIGTDSGTGDPIYETLTMNDLPALIESDPESAQALVDEASSVVASRQAEIGAEQRSNESMQRAMEEEYINVARAQSSIRDTDYAKEVSESVRASILGKASMRVLLIGQQQSERVLDLLA
jgi:flagellin